MTTNAARLGGWAVRMDAVTFRDAGLWTGLVRRLSDRLFEMALGENDLARLFEFVCQTMSEEGFPLLRAQLAVTSLHPLIEVRSFTWYRGTGLESVGHEHSDGPEPDEWLRSPIYAMLQDDLPELLLSMDDPATCDRFPLIERLKREHGASQYFGMLLGFSALGRARDLMDGMTVSFATDRPGGFDAAMLDALRRLAPRLGICVKVGVREDTGRNIAEAYLGPEAGREVLAGHIRRGDVEVIDAIFLYGDIRDSSGQADRLEPTAFLEMLNGYFERIGRAVVMEGGSVLQFAGDSLLAVFRIGEGRRNERDAAEAALRAARRALEGVTQDGDFPFGIGLHRGKALYGNIGLTDRLAFTVIGRDVNVVARLEAATRNLGVALLASPTVAALAPEELREIPAPAQRGLPPDWMLYQLR